jgi:hypothetical protein
MAQDARFRLRRYLVPDDATGSLVDRQNPELLLRDILPVVAVALWLRLEDHLRIGADGCGEKHQIIPDHRA